LNADQVMPTHHESGAGEAEAGGDREHDQAPAIVIRLPQKMRFTVAFAMSAVLLIPLESRSRRVACPVAEVKREVSKPSLLSQTTDFAWVQRTPEDEGPVVSVDGVVLRGRAVVD
jgi:hypothetical protein